MTARRPIVAVMVAVLVLLLLVVAGCAKVRGHDECDRFALAGAAKPNPPRPAVPPPVRKAPSLEKKPVEKVPAPRTSTAHRSTPGTVQGHGSHGRHSHTDVDFCD